MYSLRLSPRASKEVEALPGKVRKNVYAALKLLQSDPRPEGTRALQGDLAGNYRLRVGSRRIAYSVDDRARMVSVWHVGDRNRFYDEIKRRRR